MSLRRIHGSREGDLLLVFELGVEKGTDGV